MSKDLHNKRMEAVECIAHGPNRPAGASKEELLTIPAFVLEAFDSGDFEHGRDA